MYLRKIYRMKEWYINGGIENKVDVNIPEKMSTE